MPDEPPAQPPPRFRARSAFPHGRSADPSRLPARKIVSCFLVCALSLAPGCYSPETATKEDLASKAAQSDLTAYTKNSGEYGFSRGNYRVEGDSLKGYAIRTKDDSTEVVLRASLSFADISAIERREFDIVRTMAFGAGIGLGVLIFKTLLFR